MRPQVEKKAKQVEELKRLFNQYKVFGIIDIYGIPADVFKRIRKQIPGMVKVMKKIVIVRALNELGIKGMDFGRMPAVVLTNQDPFELSMFLMENKVPIYAKAGQTAEEDIVVHAGPTPFPPGPMVSEFNKLGIKVRPQAGKLVILQDKVLVNKGEKISEEAASMLRKLEIKPMKIGLKLVSAYENGKIFKKELQFDVEGIINSIKDGYENAFKLSIALPWISEENVEFLIKKAVEEAKKLVIAGDIYTPDMLPELFMKAQMEANVLR